MTDVVAILGNVLLFALVFGMSATVDVDCMRTQLTNVKALSTGLFCQFVLLPLLGFLVVMVLHLEPSMGITLLVVTSSPGGSYSNWWCSMFNADLALSVSMTAISTLCSVVLMPINLLFYTRFSYEQDVVGAIDWTSMFVALSIVIAAVCCGLLCSYQVSSTRFRRWANRLGNFAGVSLIIFSATMTNTGDADSKIWSRHWTFYVGVTIPCLGGLLMACAVATSFRLKKPERVTVAIECCYQNVGIATSLALTMFDGDDLNEAMGVPFFYGVVEAVLVAVFCLGAWKCGWTKAPADAGLCTVMWTSYEVLEQEHLTGDYVAEIEVEAGGGSTPNNNFKQNVAEKREGETLTAYFALDTLFGTMATTPTDAAAGSTRKLASFDDNAAAASSPSYAAPTPFAPMSSASASSSRGLQPNEV